MFKIIMKHEEQESEILSLYLRQAVFFKHFLLLGVNGTRSSSYTVQTALRLPFLFLYFLSLPLPQSQVQRVSIVQNHLGQTESSHPLSSFLGRARKNTGVLSLCCVIKNNFRRFGDLIGGLAPPSGSRRQRDNTVLSFRHTFCRN